MPDRSTLALQQAGETLQRAVGHIWVLTLPGSAARMEHMRALLEQDLQLPSKHITYFEGASSRAWGRWPSGLLPEPEEGESRPADWWMTQKICTDDDEGRGNPGRPVCLQQRYRGCLGFGDQTRTQGTIGEVTGNDSRRRLPAVCNELCYTLSVVGALTAFLRTSHERALLLEDDICATTALLSPTSQRDLRWMDTHSGQWDLVKLGDCYRGAKAFHGIQSPANDAVASGTCLSRDQRSENELAGMSPPRTSNNSLIPRLPLSHCTHALAVSRRMASYLISQSLPASVSLTASSFSISPASQLCADTHQAGANHQRSGRLR